MSQLLNAAIAVNGTSAEFATIPGNRYSITSSAAVQVQCKNLADSDSVDDWLPVNIEERKIAVGRDGAFASSFEAQSTLTRVKAGTKAADVVVFASMPDVMVGLATNPSATFTRPADTTAYAAGDLVANATAAGSVVPLTFTVARVAGGSFMLRRVKLASSSTNIANATYRLHLFATAPTVATTGDNGVFASAVSGLAGYLGSFDIEINRVLADGSVGFGVPTVGPDMSIALASGTTIRGLLEARLARTPISGEVFTVTLDNLQN